MRGSLRINFYLNSIHHFRQCTFRWQQFFNILISSDFAHRCSFWWWKPFVDIVFHLRETRKQTLGNIKKTALILSSESVNMLIRGVMVAVRLLSPGTGPPESKNKLVKQWQYWENYSLDLLNTLFIEGPFTSKKVKRRPPIQSREFRSAHSS